MIRRSKQVVTVGALGLVFALTHIWRKSLVMPMTLHFLQDFPSIVLLPLLLGGQYRARRCVKPPDSQYRREVR
jgi:hypothetical protein